ncbi:hypothetical protein [Caldisalinibacter kiritimatiensis]|uniref:Uncharacterized protein n=1 Tax=Caldisalinibacter kiritimatiensis TaxID=1304284 RepID=R1ART0_9FIRM|nr:hypothetical protein [Caldisalinibacter kiritimatiensis]EOC99371.1 hypothetical protein L21TH_2629 [Caldisalinibacter kiritimatiensis]
MYVLGRGAQVTDVMFDSFGAFIGIGMYGMVSIIKKVIVNG